MRSRFGRFLADYGMLVVLAVLYLVLSLMTISDQDPVGDAAARQVVQQTISELPAGSKLLIAATTSTDDQNFVAEARRLLNGAGLVNFEVVQGQPRDAALKLRALSSQNQPLAAIVASPAAGKWLTFETLAEDFPNFGSTRLLVPSTSRWPTFLTAENQRNIAGQIAIIAVVAIGMTLVIMTGGIDLSVGSLIALAAVSMCRLIERSLGAESASTSQLVLAGAVGIALAGGVGLMTGLLVTRLKLPPFIVTLSFMYVAKGIASHMTGGESAYRIPPSVTRFVNDQLVPGIPNSVSLMLALYLVAHVVMEHTRFGRYIYAVGGNREAARLSGVRVHLVLLAAYVICGLLAGLGGVMMASQLKAASPNDGQNYELYTIAAVVVGGTSLSGGQGKILGTLIGAYIIGVIRNGMNLMMIKDFTQWIVFGHVILIAVVLDRVRQMATRRQ